MRGRLMLVLLAALGLGFSAGAAPGESEAARACRFIRAKDLKSDCLKLVQGQKFNARAVAVCAADQTLDIYGPFVTRCLAEIRGQEYDPATVKICYHMREPEVVLKCLRLTAGRVPLDKMAYSSACFRTQHDQETLSCLNALTWQALNPISTAPTAGETVREH